jgi:hypothetical protein
LAALLVVSVYASGASASTVTYYLNQSGNATAGTLSVDNVDYATVTISDNVSTLDFTVTLLPNVIAGYNPSANYHGIASFGFNAPDTISPALSGTSTSTNGVINLPAGSGFSWTLPSSKGVDGFGTFDVKVANGNSNRVDTLTFSLDKTNARWSSVTASTFFDVSSGSAPQGNVYFAVEVDGIATSAAQGGNPSFGGSTLVTVPLPASVWLLVSGIASLFTRLPRRRTIAA